VVSAYRDAHATQVAVVSGAVALRRSLDAPSSARGGGRVPVLERSAPLMVLVPGDVARLDTTGTVTLARNVRITPYVSWTDGVLAFDGAPLRSALAELSRWYDVDFELVGHALDSTRITAEFRNESLDRATQHLALMLGVRVTHRGRSVLLSPSAHRSRDRVRAR
jgi:ferric-dicitrate binding protein FerR (iron transport regulator)